MNTSSEVGLNTLDLPENVVFVDTPGLNDPVKYRSDVTKKYIDRANAVFVCVNASKMTGEETRIIYSVFSNSSSREKIFVIGTQTDNLNTPPEQQWTEQKKEWSKYLEENAAFGNHELAESNIMPTAAYIENLCREYLNKNEDDKNVLFSLIMKYEIINMNDIMNGVDMDECVKKLREYSHIKELLEKINNGILSKYRQYLIEDIIKIYTDLKSDMMKFFREVANNHKKLLTASESDTDEIKKQYEIALENAEKNRNAKKNLTSILNILTQCLHELSYYTQPKSNTTNMDCRKKR